MAVYLGIVNDGTFVSSDGYTLKDSNGITLHAMQEVSRYKVVIDNIVYRVNVNLSSKDGE